MAGPHMFGGADVRNHRRVSHFFYPAFVDISQKWDERMSRDEHLNKFSQLPTGLDALGQARRKYCNS